MSFLAKLASQSAKQDAPATSTAPVRSPYNPTASFVKQQLAKHEAKAEARKSQVKAWDFFMKRGDSRIIIILDAALYPDPDNGIEQGGCMVKLHKRKVDGEFTSELCLEDFGVAACPYCKMGDSYSICIALTVYVVGEWTDKNGNVHPGSKRVYKMPVKAHLKTFQQFQELAAERKRALANETTDPLVAADLRQSAEISPLRGVVVNMVRGNEEKSHAAGAPSMLPGTAVMFDVISEADMIKEFGHKAVVVEGKTYKQANEDLQPFNYMGTPDNPGVFTYPDVAEAYAKAGIKYTPPIGSRLEAEEAAASVDTKAAPSIVPSFMQRIAKPAQSESEPAAPAASDTLFD